MKDNQSLLQIRKQLGWTQESMACAIGVPIYTYAQWERGQRRLPAASRSAVRMLLFIRREGLLNKWVFQRQALQSGEFGTLDKAGTDNQVSTDKILKMLGL